MIVLHWLLGDFFFLGPYIIVVYKKDQLKVPGIIFYQLCESRAGMFSSCLRSNLIFYWEKQEQVWTSRLNLDLCMSFLFTLDEYVKYRFLDADKKTRASMFSSCLRLNLIFYWEKQEQVWTSRLNLDLWPQLLDSLCKYDS